MHLSQLQQQQQKVQPVKFGATAAATAAAVGSPLFPSLRVFFIEDTYGDGGDINYHSTTTEADSVWPA